MKRLLLTLLAALPLRAADIALVDGDRIVVVGDSLTFHDGYAAWSDYVHSYLVMRNPTVDFTMEAIARSGASIYQALGSYPSVQYQEYPKWISPRQATYVFSMFADNGGFDKATYKGYAQTLVDTHIIGIDGATPYLIGMIPQADADGFAPGPDYDDANQEISTAGSGFPVYKLHQAVSSVWTQRTTMTADASTDVITATGHGIADGTRIICDTSSTMPGGLTKETYYYVRDATTNTLKLAATEGGAAIDITSAGSGTRYISANWAKLRGSAADEIHPSTAASIIAAYKIITGLGWGTDVSAATLTSAGGVTSSTDCTISANTTNAYGGIDFSRLDARLPWAIDESYRNTGRADAVALYPTMSGWQSYTLTVTGLTAGTYDVYMDGAVVASVSHTELGTGWNMADLTSGTVWTKGQAVLAAIRALQGVSSTTLAEITSPGRQGVELWKDQAEYQYETLGSRDATLITNLTTYSNSLNTRNATVVTAAQPTTLAFSLRRQGYSAEAGAVRTSTRRKGAASAQ